MATIYDVAKAAGVTATTVSNVLTGKGSVSPTTRERVMSCVRELDYQPNLVARSLIKGHTGVIGLVLPGIDNPFYAETTALVERLAYAVGLRVFMTTLAFNDQVGQKMLGDLLLRRVDGLLVISGTGSLQEIRQVVAPNLPIVYCFWENIPAVVDASYLIFDFAQGGQLAAEHLLALGHRRIGIITHINPDGNLAHDLRVFGFQEALARYSISLHPELLQPGQSTLEDGKAAAQTLLALPIPPTAIFATNDLMAMGAMSAAWESGIHIPGNLSIIGIDDISQAKYTTPPLTTIVIDKVALLTEAITLLLQTIKGEKMIPQSVFPATLVARGSTGPVSSCVL